MKNKTVERLQTDRLDGEEVGREDPFGLRPEELGPGRAGPAGSRVKAVAEQARPYRRRGDLDPELDQLPADPLVAPPRVLPAEADDEVPDLGLDPWPAGAPAPLVCPLPPDELPVPAEQGLGPDDERRPSGSRHRPARRRQQDPVETAQAGGLPPPPQHLHPVSEPQEASLTPPTWASPGSRGWAN